MLHILMALGWNFVAGRFAVGAFWGAECGLASVLGLGDGGWLVSCLLDGDMEIWGLNGDLRLFGS
jgi:hypothetical protein